MKLNGFRVSHRNKWLFIKHKILSINALLLLEFYADIFDFDIKHEDFGLFEVNYSEIAEIFGKSENTIRNWHNELVQLKFIDKTPKLHIYKINIPKRYIVPGRWQGNATIYANQEKNQPIEIILQNFGIEFKNIGDKLQPIVKKVVISASERSSITLISSKDSSKVQGTEEEILHKKEDDEETQEEGSYSSNITLDERRWIDENLSSPLNSSLQEDAPISKELALSVKKNVNLLIKREIGLRNLLNSLLKNTPEYEQKYHEWFSLRDEGLQRGYYNFFIPTRIEPWMGNVKKGADSI